ncbi:MAG TPA: hypothetical protein VG371_12200 [Solirubrobacteraceae bacterium]|nr:hypothetical protein [Solirubrobacteraceae bacterium]
MSDTAQRWSTGRLACAAAGLMLVLGGCASSSAAPSSSVSGFRSALAAATPQLRVLRDDLDSELLSARGLTSSQLAQRSYTLATAAQHNLNTVSSLLAPTRYNTRLRALRSSLGALVYDLSNVSTAAGNRNAPALAEALKTVRTDAVSVTGTDATLSRALGLSPS